MLSSASVSSGHTFNEYYPHFISLPRGSPLELIVDSVARTYSRVEVDQIAFLSRAVHKGKAFACPSGCGTCCEGFVPDVLPAEAAFIALWLLENEPDLAAEAAAWGEPGISALPPCPLLRHTSEGVRCAIYPARPLVCRLFGFAGVRDREGRTSFRPCVSLPSGAATGGARPSMVGDDLVRAYGSAPPVMADYAAELASLRPGEAAERPLLISALPAALGWVGLSLSLAEADGDRTYSFRDEREKTAASEGPARAAGR